MKATRAWWLTAVLTSLAAVAAMPVTAGAFTLRVLAATELRVEPRLAPDRSTLTLAVRLQDDRGSPLARRAVTLTVGDHVVALTLNAEGEASHVVPITRGQSVVEVSASYAGDTATAQRRASIRVNLDAPYVTVDVLAPGAGVELGAAAAPFVVTLHVGEVVSGFRAGSQGVELREGARTLAAGVTDASGRAVLAVGSRELGAAGVHKVRAVTNVEGERVEGPEHDVLVRALTSVSLVRVASDDDAAGVALRGTLLTATGAPVPDGSVRIARGAVTLAGARTDAQGRFQATLGPAVLAERGVTVRAVFEPTEPWFGASESPPLALTAPPPPRVHWLWVVAPAALAALGVAVVLVRARSKGDAPAEALPDRAPDAQWNRVEHVAPSATGGLRVRFVVVDRATTRAVSEPMVRWGADPAWRAATGESVAVQPARKVEFEVGASGYAPRKVTGEFSRPGEYVVRVQLRSWREELFERARPWLRRAGGGATALPTLREALAKRAATPNAVAFVEHIEAGCYAPESPSAREVARADELSTVMDPTPSIARD
jgi:hypothetical protein